MSWGRRRRSFLRIAQIPFPSISNTFPFPLPLPQTDTLKASWRSERCSVRTHCSASEELLCDLCRSHIKASPPSRPHVLFTATRARAHVLSALYIHMCVCVCDTQLSGLLNTGRETGGDRQEQDREEEVGRGGRFDIIISCANVESSDHQHNVFFTMILWCDTWHIFFT